VRRHPALQLTVAAVFVAMLIGAAPAEANISHVLKSTFGSSASGVTNPYPLSEPIDLAVDQATEDVYVTDSGHHRVEKFGPQGAFILMFGLEVNKTAVEASRPASEQNVCPAPGHPGDVCQPGTSAESPGAYEEPAWLAIDNYPFGGGAVYVADLGNNVVTKLNPAGEVITGWGVHGQKNGADDPNLPNFGSLFGLAVGAGCATPTEPLTGRCTPNGTLYVSGHRYGENVREYTQAGEWIVDGFQQGSVLKVNAKGDLFYEVSPFGSFGSTPEVWMTLPKPGTPGEGTSVQVTTDWPAAGFALDPSTEELYEAVETRNDELEPHGIRVDHYSADCEPQKGACEPIDDFGEGQLGEGRKVCAGEGFGGFTCEFAYKGVSVDEASHSVYVVNGNEVSIFSDARPIVTTEPATDVTTSSATLNGHVDPAGRGNITSCHFEYGFDKTYGYSVPCAPDPNSNPPGSNFTAATNVSSPVTGLSPGTHLHFRAVATNSAGATTTGADETFVTTAPPAIDGLLAEKVTAVSAELQAKVNPNGLTTTYHFQYGTSVFYGQEVSGTIPASNADQEISAQLSGLTPHQSYHFRLVVENTVAGKEEGGTTTSEDHSFSFFPPSCPNENVRQQVKANFVPECRAYELVSPGDAKGTQLYPGGPNTGYATSPSRLAFTGLWSILPESGGSPLDSVGDLYVATRTPTGWVSRYVGPPAKDVATAGGPPQGLFNQGGPPFLGYDTSGASTAFRADIIQSNDLTDLHMDTFLDWNDGSNELGFRNKTPISSNAPYVWKANGEFVDRWPTNLATVRPGLNPYLEGGVNPGGMAALNCPEIEEGPNFCPGEVAGSADLNHFAFSTEWNIFAPGGQLSAPGSVYDNDTGAGSVTVASKLPSGSPIPAEPTDHAGDPLEVPGLSTNGSHVLIDSPGTGPCGLVNCPVPPCGTTFGGVIHCPTYPGHFYMRVNGAVTFDVSQGHDVTYVGTTADYSKVYFTSEEQLTNEDHDASVDLYMWSQKGDEEGHPLVLVSKGNNAGNAGEPGQSDSCVGGFSISGEGKSKNCDVITYSEQAYCQLTGGQGGNCRSDNSIAAENGDIYFFSPEQLDGSRGIPNRLNLYDFRNGAVQFVATFSGGQHCIESPVPGFTDNACSATPIARLQVSPDDSHAAFLTDSPVTQYNSAGFLEMYVYDPASRRLVCASCVPNGEPPSSDAEGSQDGLFMTNDGRVFFSTEDALTHTDTNNAQDVYEYIEGRPQLITTGTGETRVAAGFTSSLLNPPGLVGVSADGTDVYFSTYDTLTPADRNGLFLKFYDARSGGGFPSNAEQPPCEAADECHGAGSLPLPPIRDETGGSLTGGNAGSAKPKPKRHSRHRRHKARHHRGHGGAR
jgi:hypothetical protein